MSTYQGAKHLEEQLGSLAAQTRPPDEIIVCDDGSADGTVELLQRFRARSTFPVEIHKNPRRLGAAKSFERAVSFSRGGIVFLCDQDDVWSPIKLDRVLTLLETSPEIGAVFSDAELLDRGGHPSRKRLWSTIGVDERWRSRFSRGDRRTRVRMLAQGNAASGATLAFRSRFRDLLLPIPEGWGHDEWIALLLAAVTDLRMLPDALVGYRIHPGQRIGLGRHPTWGARWRSRSRSSSERTRRREELLARADLLDVARDRLRDRAAHWTIPSAALTVLASHSGHLRARARTSPRGRRVGGILTELLAGRYHRFSRGWASVARDLLESG